MRIRRKTDQVVRKIMQGNISQGFTGAAVFGMAFTAFEDNISAAQNPMKFMRICHFLANVRVAANTPILHEVCIPWRSMALLAIVSDLGVRSDVAKNVTCPCA